MNIKILIILLSLLSCAVSMRAKGMLKERSRYYEFKPEFAGIRLDNATEDVILPQEFSERFLIKFKLGDKCLKESRSLMALGDALNVEVKNGELQATLHLCDSLTGNEPKLRNMTIGAPLACFDSDLDIHEVALYYNSSHFSIYIDRRLIDNDFPIGSPAVGKTNVIADDSVKEPILYVSPVTVRRVGNSTFSDVQYWTPPFHNAWVGDVATCWADGRYHVFYLFDRRGHGSKFGYGGHYFEHISTADLINWTEHEEATPIEEQWETFGTGTPFEKDGKIYLTYGLHTTRIYPQERTVQPVIKEWVRQSGKTPAMDYDTLDNLMPAGATFVVSEDGGKTFKKSHKLFHYCENPSIWVGQNGELNMYANYGARGFWRSDVLESGWSCVNPDFPEGRDCTFPFRFGKYDYVIGGFSGMWRRSEGDSAEGYTDISEIGEDCYDGLSVPAVTTLPDGRTLVAGWIKMQNWGGALAIHEMVECSDGVPGTKFVEELIPDLPLIGDLEEGVTKAVPESYRYEFAVSPSEAKDNKVTLKFGEDTFWTLDFTTDRIYYASDAETRSRTLAEGGDVSTARDYAIPARLSGAGKDQKIKVRAVIKYDPKYNGSVIDVEVNGNRSMISYRPGLKSREITKL